MHIGTIETASLSLPLARPRGLELATLILELLRYQTEATGSTVSTIPTLRETCIFGEFDLLELANDLDTFFADAS